MISYARAPKGSTAVFLPKIFILTGTLNRGNDLGHRRNYDSCLLLYTLLGREALLMGYRISLIR